VIQYVFFGIDYNGWTNPQYDVFINYRNQWVKWNTTPITDTTYCMTSDTLEVGSYNIKVVTQNNGYISESNYVTCVKPEPPNILIPNVVTPNGDGVNDMFVIRNLLLYSYRQLVVYNRWGSEVYRSDQYNNNWDGMNVPDGVYFGVVQINLNGQIESYPFHVSIFH
jgi:gliding motility-associated-like protein